MCDRALLLKRKREGVVGGASGNHDYGAHLAH